MLLTDDISHKVDINLLVLINLLQFAILYKLFMASWLASFFTLEKNKEMVMMTSNTDPDTTF